MRRTAVRVRVDDVGKLEVVDPGYDTLPLLRAVDPDFTIATERLAGFTQPRLIRAAALGAGMSRDELDCASMEALIGHHQELVATLRGTHHSMRLKRSGEISTLELKAAISRRMLAACVLCARRCGVNRLGDERGPCGLGHEAYVAEHFVHIAEEPPINPSLLVSLRGCGLRCRYCQQHELLDAKGSRAEVLGRSLWRRLDFANARSMSFIGGNPDESLPSILNFLCHAPRDLALPVVWNHHAYATDEGIELLDYVADVYVPDLKYGSDACALRLSGVTGYCAATQRTIRRQLEQGVPVIVRILVLPGHLECCHRPALEFLASLERRDRLSVSIRGQYSPDWKIAAKDGLLARRTLPCEIGAVQTQALRLGLHVVGDGGAGVASSAPGLPIANG